MSWIVVSGIGIGALIVVALLMRRPLLVGVTAGLFGGPLFYYWLGGHLARAHGEGRFYSWPLGGYRLGDLRLVASLGFWVVAFGVAAWLVTRLTLGRRTNRSSA